MNVETTLKADLQIAKTCCKPARHAFDHPAISPQVDKQGPMLPAKTLVPAVRPPRELLFARHTECQVVCRTIFEYDIYIVV